MISPLLSRRAALLGLFALVPSAACAAEKPYDFELLQGGFDGMMWRGGVRLALQEGWKTYWRVPGEGGVPPDISAKGDNLKNFAFDCPLPSRITGGDGESIGYKHEVVFPFTVEPLDAAKPVAFDLEGFFGVCETICIPAQFRTSVSFDPALTSTNNDVLAAWQARVPERKPDGVVLKAESVAWPEPVVKLSLAPGVKDLFIEGNPLLYFGPPQWTGGRGAAMVKVSGLAPDGKLAGEALRVTLDMGGRGLEQMVTVV